MKRETLEQWMLLEAAGELDGFRRWWLRRAVARQPALREWQQELEALQALARATAPAVPPLPRDVRAAILEAAAAEPARGHALSLRPAWAGAAALVLAGGIVLMRPAGTPPSPSAAHPAASKEVLAWEDGLDTKLATLQTQLGGGSESWYEGRAGASDLDAMATVLLSEDESSI